MRVSSILTSLYLATSVIAGGYPGSLERILLYYAYQIDGLNDKGAHRLGWKCNDWAETENRCKGQWVEYACQSGPSGRCSFNQLMMGLGCGVDGTAHLVPGANENALSFKDDDREKVAVNYYQFIRGVRTDGRVPNFAPHTVMKGTDRFYHPFIGELGDLVQAAASKKTSSNSWMFEEFQKTLKDISIARVGDHGLYAIKEAKDNFGSQFVVTRNVGSNPALKPQYSYVDWWHDSKNVWSEVDWDKTKAKIQGANPTLAATVDRVRADFYASGEPKKHMDVMVAYREMETKIAPCLR